MTDVTPEATTPQVWRVVENRGRGSRVLFEGSELQARRYIRDNFPRPHVESGAEVRSDVVLTDPSGGTSEFRGLDDTTDPNDAENGFVNTSTTTTEVE